LADAQEQFQAYINRDSTAIEKEVAGAVKQHLQRIYKGHSLYTPNIKILKDPHDDSKRLTDLDGVFIMTNDPDTFETEEVIQTPMTAEIRQLLKLGDAQRRTLKKQFQSKKLQEKDTGPTLVVVEAKHFVTQDKVKQKLEQKKVIEEYLRLAKVSKTSSDETLTRKFRANVEQNKYDTYNATVLLFIGGTLWDDRAFSFIEQEMKTDPDLVQSVGIVKPTGRRFGVADVTTQFVLQDGGDDRGKITFYAKRANVSI
jgi:hypothetical protein